jgi:hypothetical protein
MGYLIAFILMWPIACLMVYTAIEIAAYRAGGDVQDWIKELSDTLTELGMGGGTPQEKHCAYCGGEGHLAKDCPWRTLGNKS